MGRLLRSGQAPSRADIRSPVVSNASAAILDVTDDKEVNQLRPGAPD